MKKIKNIIWKLITGISIFGLIVLLLSAFADCFSPLSFPYIPFFGLFFPFILAFNVLFFIFWIISWIFFKKWKQMLFTLFVFIICWGSIRTYFPINSKTKEIPENSIKILTYNVMRFEYFGKHTQEKTNPIIQYIVDEDPDIVCIQEYGIALDNKKQLMGKDITTALKKLPYHEVVKLSPHSKSHLFGLAVFSKYPILSVKKMPFESEYNGSAVFELDINGRRVTLINNHLESNKISADERSGYFDLTQAPSTQKIEAFTHLMFQRLTPAFKIRAEQATEIREVIKATENPYIIVCGDFNDTPISYARQKIGKDLKDAFVESGSGMGVTFNRHRFLFRIDYILHSKNMKAHNCTVGKLMNSDHYPVWTYLEFLD